MRAKRVPVYSTGGQVGYTIVWKQRELDLPEPTTLPLIETAKGRSCEKCEEFSEYADSNQPDGGFVCYACRQNRYR